MLQVTPHMRLFVALEPVDFRRGIDGLAAVCRQRLGVDPMGGALLVFRNRTGTALKVLVYDGQGYWLCHKRFSSGRLSWWPTEPGEARRSMEAVEFQALLYGGDPSSVRPVEVWRRVKSEAS